MTRRQQPAGKLPGADEALALYKVLLAEATARHGRPPREGETVIKQFIGAPTADSPVVVDVLVAISDHATVDRIVDQITHSARFEGSAVDEWLQHLS